MAFGIKKLQIGCVVEDDKVGTDFLEDKIQEFEDHVSAKFLFLNLLQDHSAYLLYYLHISYISYS